MANKLDLDLNSIIQADLQNRGRGRGRGLGRSRSGYGAQSRPAVQGGHGNEANGTNGTNGAVRRRRSSRGRRNSPYNLSRTRAADDMDVERMWPHDRYHGTSDIGATASFQQQQAEQAKVRGDTIFVSNLEKEVTQDDIHDIFSRIGQVKTVNVNYNQYGQSSGTAEVTFQQHQDAETAVREYDGAEVDGRPMMVKIIGSFVRTPTVVKRQPPAMPQQQPGQLRRQRVITNTGRGGKGGGGRSGKTTAGGRQRQQQKTSKQQQSAPKGRRSGRRSNRSGRKSTKPLSAAELDAQLDSYQAARGGSDGTTTADVQMN